jgi:hypothetical protein
MPKYIIYALKQGEEYVLGVHPWVLYPDAKTACDAILNQVLGYIGSISSVYTNDTSYYVNQHMPVVLAPDGAKGYVARVE